MAKATETVKIPLLVDGHCDTLLDLAYRRRDFREKGAGHLDLPRMLEGRVKVQFFAAFIESKYKPFLALPRALQLIDVYYHDIVSCPEIFPVTSVKDLNAALQTTGIASILAIEGGEALAGELAVLRIMHRLGVRSIGLTWNQRNNLADGVWEDSSGGGLTRLGREVIGEMNRLGMLVDLAHISEKGFWHSVEHSEKPVAVTHANSKSLCNHPRNLTDEQIKVLAEAGGVVGITMAPEFIDEKNPTLGRVIEHIEHMVEVGGIDCVGLGSDFDGIESLPEGIEDVSGYPLLVRELRQRGFSAMEVEAITGGNFLRLLRQVLP